MEPKRSVDLVRVQREETYYDKEDVLGRDVQSVFPTESKKEHLKNALEHGFVKDERKFISETELRESHASGVKQSEGGGTKPLAEILRQQKEAKQAKFEEGWKQMKQGKNRPLDEEEATFLDTIMDMERKKQQAMRAEEEKEIRMFREALNSRSASLHVAISDGEGKGFKRKGTESQTSMKKKKPLVIVHRKKENANKGEAQMDRKEHMKEEERDGGAVLGSLFADYGSDDDS